MSAHGPESLDRTAALALGTLGSREARAASAHLRACEPCTREYEALRPIADLVGLDAEAEHVDPAIAERMRGRVLAAIAERRSRPALGVLTALPAGRPRFAGRALLAACAVLALGTSLAAARLEAVRRSDESRLRALAGDLAQTRRTSEILAAVAAPGARRFPVPDGEIVVSQGGLYLVLARVAAPPPGHVFQLWTLARGERAVRPSVTFSPTAGETTIVHIPAADARDIAAVALSIEPQGGSTHPTTAPRFVRKLA